MHAGAHLLASPVGETGAKVRRRFDGLLAAMQRYGDRVESVGPALNHFRKVARSYRPGLFQAADMRTCRTPTTPWSKCSASSATTSGAPPDARRPRPARCCGERCGWWPAFGPEPGRPPDSTSAGLFQYGGRSYADLSTSGGRRKPHARAFAAIPTPISTPSKDKRNDSAALIFFGAGGALWNSGYFLFRADLMLAELEAFVPDVLEAARAALDAAVTDLDFVRLDAEAFARAPKISIDYAVMERTARAGVLPVSFPWSDVGTWDAVWQVLDHDAEGNAVRGRVSLIGTKNSLVHSQGGGLTAVVGLEDVVVVSTPDAVLVASKARSGEVKQLVNALRASNEPEADAHLRMYRPWGWYQRIDIGERFQVKRIQVVPGGRLSLQKHYHRAEHWVVVRGTAEVTVGDRVVLVHENEAVYLPIGSMHRLNNPGKIPLELIEVQVGSYTGEDDIIRVDDIYGR